MKNVLVFVSAMLLLMAWGCSDMTSPPTQSSEQEIQEVEVPKELSEVFKPFVEPEGELPPGACLAPQDLTSPDPVDTSFDLYSVTFIWGHLPPHPSTTDRVTDWAGSLSMNGVGFIRSAFTIFFEPDQDSLLPQTSPTMVEWASTTGNGFDGVNFLVFVKRGIVYIMQPKLTFDTDPITLEFDFAHLVHFSALYQIDNVNSVLVHARKVPHYPCRRGYFAGEWLRDENANDNGHFRAVWMDHHYGPTGLLNGTFWTNNDGSREFAGDVSGYLTDHIVAEVKGRWFYDDPAVCITCGEGAGKMIGTFEMLDGSGTGDLEGRFGRPGISMFEKRLSLMGTWRIHCPEADPDTRGLDPCL